jgi:CDP-4-dehydro-6-deoxyglucose reductase, E1
MVDNLENGEKQKLFYPLASSSWDQDELDAIQRVVDTGNHSMGYEVSAFEKEFAAWNGARHAIMVNSGSSANLLGFNSLLYVEDKPLSPGDKVVVPAVSWGTTYFPLYQSGYVQKFVDVDPETFNIDLNQVEEALADPAVKAVVAVNLLGNPCELDQLAAMCDRRGVLLLEDNCESFGASLKGRKTGTFGRLGTFSFFFSHHLCTMEGGMVITDDDELYEAMIAMRAHGWTRDLPQHSRFQIDADEFIKKFRFVLPGFNLRPLEIQAAIGRVQLTKADGFIAGRRRNAEIFKNIFGGIPGINLQRETGEHSWLGYALVLNNADGNRMQEVVSALDENGIETRPILAGNFLNNPVVTHMPHETPFSYKNAEMLDRAGLFLGSHIHSLEKEIEKSGSIVADVLARPPQPRSADVAAATGVLANKDSASKLGSI